MESTNFRKMADDQVIPVRQRVPKLMLRFWRTVPLVGVIFGIALMFSVMAAAQSALKGDPTAGKPKAALCAACHGPAGVSVNPLWPSLAGQQEQYLVKQIRMFRDGEREEITMQPFVQNLSDQDIADLAAYYAQLSPCP